MENGYPYSKSIRQIYKEVYKISIGYGSYGGCFNVNNIPANVSFGNYCSIAKNVKIFRANHPINLFTTHPILYNPELGYVKKDKLNRPKLSIGNDVWIGANVVILPSVNSIGNGVIIGAGSVVTKDVEPYMVLAGNPAKAIKKRFPELVIDKLENSKWWDLEFDDLTIKIPDLNKIIDDSI